MYLDLYLCTYLSVVIVVIYLYLYIFLGLTIVQVFGLTVVQVVGLWLKTSDELSLRGIGKPRDHFADYLIGNVPYTFMGLVVPWRGGCQVADTVG